MRSLPTSCTIILGFCAVAMLAPGCVRIGNVGIGGLGGTSDELLEKTVIPADKPMRADKVLMLDIEGAIGLGADEGLLGGYRPGLAEQIRAHIEKARDDKRVKAIVLRINSPGGEVTATDIIYRELAEFKEEKDIVVVAAMMQVAASGGYYVACVADKIMAHPSTITGSISVVAQMFNVKGLLDKVGVEHEALKTGEHKDMGSPFRPLTPEERLIFQELIDGSQEQFIDVIDAGRPNLTRDEVAELATGRIFSGTQAKACGLVDEIGYLEDAFEAAKQLAGLDDASLVVYSHRTTQEFNLYSPTATSPASLALNQASAARLLGALSAPAPFAGPSLMCLWDMTLPGAVQPISGW
jgi:protease IV